MKIWQFIQDNFIELMSIIGSFFALFRTRKKLTSDQKREKKIRKLTAKTEKLIATAEKSAVKAEKTAEKLDKEIDNG